MSEKKDLNKEELNKVSGGIGYGRLVNLATKEIKTAQALFKPEDVGMYSTDSEEK